MSATKALALTSGPLGATSETTNRPCQPEEDVNPDLRTRKEDLTLNERLADEESISPCLDPSEVFRYRRRRAWDAGTGVEAAFLVGEYPGPWSRVLVQPTQHADCSSLMTTIPIQIRPTRLYGQRAAFDRRISSSTGRTIRNLVSSARASFMVSVDGRAQGDGGRGALQRRCLGIERASSLAIP